MVRRLAYLAGAVLVVGLAAKSGAQESRSIALILDASGSMNAKLASGGTRIDAAKAAVAAFVASETMPAARIVDDAEQRMKSATKKKPRTARIARMDEP